MSTHVEESVDVNLPVSTVYNQWTQFEEFPQFMSGVTSVTQLSDDRLEWVAEIAGVRRRWQAKVLEQIPERKVAWAATEGATNAGAVTFQDLGGRTLVHLSLEYEPEGLVEKVGDRLNVVENRAKGDLARFKSFVESEGYATGAWRGSVNTGGTEARPASMTPTPPVATGGKQVCPVKLWPQGSASQPPRRPRLRGLPLLAEAASPRRPRSSRWNPSRWHRPRSRPSRLLAPLGSRPRPGSSPMRRPARSSKTPRTGQETRTTVSRFKAQIVGRRKQPRTTRPPHAPTPGPRSSGRSSTAPRLS